jgi:crotonobetainyl-CoA:carnitine CoA-transferase CaiB-like acyl-CoA transferase
VYAGVLLDEHWQILAELIGQAELAEHESFATREARAVNRDVCNTLFGSWLAERTRAEAIETLRAVGLPAARVQTFAEVNEDPHIHERDMLQMTTHHDGTTVPVVGPSWKFSRTPTRVRTPAPAIGEHNDEILAEIGITPEQIAAMREAGILT